MRLGIALGGGGARGLAHIAVLEVLDELGIQPHRITGTSIGAIVGAAYASGATAAELRRAAENLIASDRVPLTSWFSDDEPAKHWLQLLRPNWGTDALLNADRFLEEFQQQWGIKTFDKLSIPLSIVAADYWSRQEVVLSTGEIMTAIRASMAVPGLFAPVAFGKALLVDGGVVNPVPFDLLLDDCDFTIAVDIMGQRTLDTSIPPNLLECILGTFQIMQRSIIEQKLAIRRPDVYLAPEIQSVRVLEFNKADQIMEECRPACDHLRALLQALR